MFETLTAFETRQQEEERKAVSVAKQMAKGVVDGKQYTDNQLKTALANAGMTMAEFKQLCQRQLVRQEQKTKADTYPQLTADKVAAEAKLQKAIDAFAAVTAKHEATIRQLRGDVSDLAKQIGEAKAARRELADSCDQATRAAIEANSQQCDHVRAELQQNASNLHRLNAHRDAVALNPQAFTDGEVERSSNAVKRAEAERTKLQSKLDELTAEGARLYALALEV